MTVESLPKIPNLSASVESPARLMSVLRARCIARYRLHSVPGRPEELESNAFRGSSDPLPMVISFGYSHGQVRIRKHGGDRNREWVDTRDIQFREGWLSDVYDYLDSWFGYADPSIAARKYTRSDRPTFNDPNTGQPL